MYRLTHIDSGFEWSFATLAEAIEYLETFERQEEFEIRRQTVRSIFLFKKTNICAIAPGPILARAGRLVWIFIQKIFKKLLTGHCICGIITLSDRGNRKGVRYDTHNQRT